MKSAAYVLLGLCLAAMAHARSLQQFTSTTSMTVQTTSGTAPITSQSATAPISTPATVASVNGGGTASQLLSGFKLPSWFSSAPTTTTTTTTTLPTTMLPTFTSSSAPSGPTAAVPTTSAQTAVPSSSGGSCPDAQRALDLHNQARAKRGAQPLSWSTNLAAAAQSWSNYCRFQHSGVSGQGENLYTSTSASSGCADATALWLAEEPYYTGSYSSQTGHYTQAVWKATTQIGCGLARCGTGVLVTCRYVVPGNVMGQFAANV